MARLMPHTEDNAAATARYHVPNLERALHIMEHMAVEGTPLGISAIAEALGYPKNSVFRIVTTLHAHGYLRRDNGSKQFTLGPKLLTLGYAAVQEGQLVERAVDVMREIRDQADETTMVGVIVDHEGIVLEHVPSNQQVKVVVAVGSRFPLHTAAPAKAILAYMNPTQRDAILNRITYPKMTATTLCSARAFAAELDATRERGYAVDNGEHNEGIRCVAAPVFRQGGEPVAAIWVTGPSFRISEEDFPRLGRIVAHGAQRVSRRLGCDV